MVWTQQAKLTASDTASGDNFGNSVSVSGGTAIIGADRDDGVSSYNGSAYAFDLVPPAALCDPSVHDADQNADYVINLSELLRVIQLVNLLGYHYCGASATEDGFCPGS